MRYKICAVGAQIGRLFVGHANLLRTSLPEIVASATLLLIPAGIVLIGVDSQYFQLSAMPLKGSFLEFIVHILGTNLLSALFFSRV